MDAAAAAKGKRVTESRRDIVDESGISSFSAQVLTAYSCDMPKGRLLLLKLQEGA